MRWYLPEQSRRTATPQESGVFMSHQYPIETRSREVASQAIAEYADSLDEAGEDDFFVNLLRTAAKMVLKSPQAAMHIFRLWTPIRLPDGSEAVDIRTVPADDRRN